MGMTHISPIRGFNIGMSHIIPIYGYNMGMAMSLIALYSCI